MTDTPPRTCDECGTALAADAHWKRRFCSDICRYKHRDKQPARLEADAERHRTRYHSDTDHREARRAKDRARYRTGAGIPLDAPLSNRGRRRIETKDNP